MRLTIENLWKSFSAQNVLNPVFAGLSVEIQPGEFFGILGPSGCGKTTLLNLVCGFDTPDGGNIRFGDREITGPSKDIIMVFQDFNQLLPWKTVAANVSLPYLRQRRSESRETENERVRALLGLVGLAGREDSYPHQLSGGMKQRAALARALAAEPRVLCLDEPFGSVDAVARGRLQELLLKIWEEQGIMMVFVTHDIREALLLAQRIMLIDRPAGPPSVIENTLERPRNPHSPDFQREAHHLFDRMSGTY